MSYIAHVCKETCRLYCAD